MVTDVMLDGLGQLANLVAGIGALAAAWVAVQGNKAAERRYLQERMDKAGIAAAKTVNGLERLADRIGQQVTVLVVLEFPVGQNGNQAVLDSFHRAKARRALQETLHDLQFDATEDVLLALAPLPNKCANQLAHGLDQLKTLRLMVGEWDPNFYSSEQAVLPSEGCTSDEIADWATRLEDAHRRIVVAARVCRKAAGVAAPKVTADQFYSE